jgi:hypothetical protein
MGLSRVARGALLIASKARCGPIPFRWACLGRSAGTVLRSCAGMGRIFEVVQFLGVIDGCWRIESCDISASWVDWALGWAWRWGSVRLLR